MRLPVKLWRMAKVFSAYRVRREQLATFPLRIWIETASCCNLRCTMCLNKDLAADRKGLMDLDLFKKIIDECAEFATDVYLHHRGEPLMNPALFDMIKYARAAGLKTRFHSNGNLLTQERACRLLEAGPNLVSFSIDGFTRETYERVRQGGDFKRVVENIVYLAEQRKARQLKRPYLIVEKIRFNDTSLNAATPEADATRARFLAAGIDEIIEKQEYAWAEETTPENTTELSLTACTFPWYAMVVCFDGTVTPCPQDFYAVLKMGNAREQSLREIWNGAAYRDLRHRFKTDIQSLTLCRKCDRLRRPTVGGVPLQYMVTFLTDQLLGYSRWRKKLGAHERN